MIATKAPPLYRCGSCAQPIRLFGSRIQRVNGLRQRIGQCCARKLAK